MGGVGRQEKLDFVISGAMLGWALDKQQQFFLNIFAEEGFHTSVLPYFLWKFGKIT